MTITHKKRGNLVDTNEQPQKRVKRSSSKKNDSSNPNDETVNRKTKTKFSKFKETKNSVNADVKKFKIKKTQDAEKHDGDSQKKILKKNNKSIFHKTFVKNKPQEKKPEIKWAEFKKLKKEVREKRKNSNALYNQIVEANRLSERLRRKTLDGGQQERNMLVQQLHKILKENGNYQNFVLKHDTARIVQYLLKFSNEQMKREISKYLIPSVVVMMQSKYGRYCVKFMLKYGTAQTRSEIIESFYGNAIKLSSNSVSAPVFEYAYSTWASAQHKRDLLQEFFSDMYKVLKEDHIHHLKDVYSNSPDMKSATLGATKANLLKILNKGLLDSSLVHTVLYQFLSECSPEDRTEIISQLTNHVVVLSNSKDGAKVAIQCIWHGTNKDRKVIIKTIKGYLIDLAKHEHGHATIIGLLDAADDTVLMQKAILTPLLEHAYEIASDDWGRKVILWLVAPADSAHFHPVFIKELEEGRKNSTSKKDSQVRQKELLSYCIERLLQQVASAPKDWLSTSAIAIVTLAILKAGSGKTLENAYDSIVEALMDSSWKVKEEENEYSPVEHPGLHLVLKKLAQHDKIAVASNSVTFGERLLNSLNEETVKQWIKTNRGCFFLVLIFENGTDDTKERLKSVLKSVKSLIKSEASKGSSVLLKKLK